MRRWIRIFSPDRTSGSSLLGRPEKTFLHGLEIDGRIKGHVIQDRGNGRGGRDFPVGDAEDLGQDESRRPHDRGHDLSSGGGHGLHRCGKRPLKTAPLHHRNGEHPVHHHIGHCASGDGPVERAGDHAHLRCAPPKLSSGKKSEVGKELAPSALFQESAEKNEVENQFCGHADGQAINSIGGERLQVNEPLKDIPRCPKRPGKYPPAKA